MKFLLFTNGYRYTFLVALLSERLRRSLSRQPPIRMSQPIFARSYKTALVVRS